MSEDVLNNENQEIVVEESNLPKSQSELDAAISKAVDKALKNNTSKLQSEFDTKLEEALEKERSYAKLSEKEKEEAKLSEREQALIKRERAIELAELSAEVKADVLEKELPVELVDFLVVLNDKELILDAVNSIKALVDEQVREGIKDSLRQDAPIEPRRDYNASTNDTSLAKMAAKHRIIK